jgi:hypothetical protein
MENSDFGVIGILILIMQQLLLPSIPAIIIGTAGVLAVRKGYPKSGISIIASAAVSMISAIWNIIILRSMELSAYSSLHLYIFQGLDVLSSGLLCGGLLGLIIAVPRTSDSV